MEPIVAYGVADMSYLNESLCGVKKCLLRWPVGIRAAEFSSSNEDRRLLCCSIVRREMYKNTRLSYIKEKGKLCPMCVWGDEKIF